jgi:hypothetical protein
MDAEQFRECLLVYGADVLRWPDEIRQAGLELLGRSLECRSLQEYHARFEEVLRARRYEEPTPDLARRIISAALRRRKKPSPGLAAFLAACFADFRLPKPVLTAVAVLIVGFVVGFLLSPEQGLVGQEQSDLQEFLYAAREVP